MDFIVNLRTFLAVARLGSFSAAAREAGTVPSVVSKRVSQLEHMCRAQLFERSTRGLELTSVGRTCQQKFSELLSEIEATIEAGPARNRLSEQLRIKCPTTMSVMHFSDIFCDFQIAHPGVRIDLNLVDRSVNPIEEGYDIAIGALPATYPQVHETALCSLPRKLVAAPSYFEGRPMPKHPSDLNRLDGLVFRASGSTWSLVGPAGEVAVEVNAVFSATDTRILRHAAERGLGVALIAEPLTREALASGQLIELLPEWRVPDLYLKAMVPERRMQSRAVRLLLDALVAATQPVAPWDRA
ncbi:LysR family transcriptional regulator [Pararhodobacter aggregans]|uniref:Transcriptional regulator n=1 Tax=Pararhodobacter aggregans TaxID=404875 RepID=A0A2T7UT34_9RHOB|nr:LysR family transcriptional regulator [Pararhodobacter aggregans]PTX03451.1 LysR family transcriptional regulator [Pararhodobacter aggregans]PVE47741.1 transcriptional regulator [Pararhodobacter aggregans]